MKLQVEQCREYFLLLPQYYNRKTETLKISCKGKGTLLSQLSVDISVQFHSFHFFFFKLMSGIIKVASKKT